MQENKRYKGLKTGEWISIRSLVPGLLLTVRSASKETEKQLKAKSRNNKEKRCINGLNGLEIVADIIDVNNLCEEDQTVSLMADKIKRKKSKKNTKHA